MDKVKQISEAIVGLKWDEIAALTNEAVEAGVPALEKAGLRQKTKIIVGGAPVTQAYADQIGADGYGADAVAAVEKARALVSTQWH